MKPALIVGAASLLAGCVVVPVEPVGPPPPRVVYAPPPPAVVVRPAYRYHPYGPHWRRPWRYY